MLCVQSPGIKLPRHGPLHEKFGNAECRQAGLLVQREIRDLAQPDLLFLAKLHRQRHKQDVIMSWSSKILPWLSWSAVQEGREEAAAYVHNHCAILQWTVAMQLSWS